MNGRPIQAALVMLLPVDSGAGSYNRDGSTDSAGAFTLTAIAPPSLRTLRGSMIGYASAKVPMDVRPDTTAWVTIRLQRHNLCPDVITVLSPTTAEMVAPELPKFSEIVNGRTERVTYRGRPAVKTFPATVGKDDAVLAILDRPDFKDGTIQLDVAGMPRADAPPDSRGFIGISFRTGAHGAWGEIFYLRPTNGRADDQLRRNHSAQYESMPEFPWHRLRKESPGVYESYVDLEGGAWTTMKVVVEGTTARLYVNGASQPCLVVTDLKHGAGPGRIALWAHVETDAYFGPVTVTPR